ncbi:VOC family protein [Colwellia psychrerythraea]|nr:VOC family protein [Colwellia psychrerythraea]
MSSLTSAETIDIQKQKVMTQGLSHLGLTVSKLEQTTRFFTDTLGWRLAGEKPAYPAKFVTDGNMFITLWQVSNGDTVVNFDRKNNVGLHHLALSVASKENLVILHERFKTVDDLVIEFGPEINGQGPTVHMMIREPSGNRIEFTYKP